MAEFFAVVREHRSNLMAAFKEIVNEARSAKSIVKPLL
jgi:hypothetical protein